MMSVPHNPPNAPLHPLLIAALLTLAVFVFTGAWLIVATACTSRAGWMTLIAAAISITLLRVARMHPGTPRMLLAAFVTSASIALGEWLVAALPIAQQSNQSPLEAAQRMGFDFGWMLIRLGNSPLDWGLIAVALVLAIRFSR